MPTLVVPQSGKNGGCLLSDFVNSTWVWLPLLWHAATLREQCPVLWQFVTHDQDLWSLTTSYSPLPFPLCPSVLCWTLMWFPEFSTAPQLSSSRISICLRGRQETSWIHTLGYCLLWKGGEGSEVCLSALQAKGQSQAIADPWHADTWALRHEDCANPQPPFCSHDPIPPC